MNGYEMPAEILHEELEFIRTMKDKMQTQLDNMNKQLKYNQGRSDDATYVRYAYMKIINELDILLRHEYDALDSD